jgi:hypothetical protein
MGLAHRRELRLDPDMELLTAGLEPDASASAERLGLDQLGQAKQLAEEPPRRLLAPAWRGDLHMVKPLDKHWSEPSASPMWSRRVISGDDMRVV